MEPVVEKAQLWYDTDFLKRKCQMFQSKTTRKQSKRIATQQLTTSRIDLDF